MPQYTANQLVQMGYGGYAGWGDQEATNNFIATGGAGKGSGASPSVTPSTVAPGATSSSPLPTAPSGGFQQGGWYNGRQYWNGTFSQPGQIHPESNQQGAGTMVSPEILAATSVAAGNAPGANQAYINSQYSNPSGGSSTTAPNGAGSGATGLGSIGSGVSSGLNLMEEQQSLYDSSGITQLLNTISGIQATIDNYKSEADKRRAEVNENPFLSESSRVGRIRKIDDMLNDTLQSEEAKLANYNTQVTQKQNEINEKLGLKVKQFDIERATRQENRDLFNSLLSSGALNGATEQDLGNLAAQTGLSINFIRSAIKASQKADVEIITQTDNAGNVTILTIDKNTGQIVNQVSAGNIAKGSSGGGGSTGAVTAATIKSFNTDADTVTWSKEADDAGNVVDVSPFMKLVIKYASKMSLDEIYSYYLKSSLGKAYGNPTEDKTMITALYNQARGL
jgi:hypothetical protein